VRLRTGVTKKRRLEDRGAGDGRQAARVGPRTLDGHELVSDVLNAVKFTDGIKVTQDHNHDDGTTDEKVAA
jgi:hypothetical protein